MTKVSEFRGKTMDELSDQLVKLKKEQFNLRFQRASGQLENTARVRFIRQDIARVLTLLNQNRSGAVVMLQLARKEVKPKKAKAPPAASADETKKHAAKKAKGTDTRSVKRTKATKKE